MDDILTPADIQNEIVPWARQRRWIEKLWLFGSRAKGTARPDSDVDLAFVLDPSRFPSRETPFSFWCGERPDIERELGLKLGKEVQAEMYCAAETPNVVRYVKEFSILIYSRSSDA